jgi:hydroxyethylthiazole kinase-like uncharacterized protein yjeF
MSPSHPAEVVDADWLAAHPLPAIRRADKYERGTVLVVGGSPFTPGAVLLAGRAALRMGAGRLRVATAEQAAIPLAVALPEAHVSGLPTLTGGGLGVPTRQHLEVALDAVEVVLVGPGAEPAGIHDLVAALVAAASPTATFVMDAAAIGAVAELPAEHRTTLEGRLVLTPNSVELSAAVGDPNEDEPLGALAARLGAVVTSFGRVVCPSGRSLIVPDRPAALGTSGSGDVLAGLAAGAAALNDDLFVATAWATHAHVDAGERLVRRRVFGAYLASELVEQVGIDR